MSKAYEHAFITRAPGKVSKPDVIRLEVKHPDLEALQLKGEYIGPKALETALKYAATLTDDVRRIGV